MIGFNLQFGIPFKILQPAKYMKNETHHPLEIADTKLGESTQNESDQFNNLFNQGTFYLLIFQFKFYFFYCPG